MRSATTNQHYVPQLLLKHFVSGDSKDVFVFDKHTGRSFRTSIKGVAFGSGFYDYEVDGESYSVDPLLTRMENVASRIIGRIVAARNLHLLSASDRKIVALFAAVQMLRTEAQRKEMKDLSDTFHYALGSAGMDPAKVQGFDFLDAAQTRVFSITSLPSLAANLMPYFLNKSWILHSTTEEYPFYISDNPVSRFNRNEHRFLSMLGLRARGIQIYLPLSSTLCLGFLCPSIKLPLRIRLFGGTLGLRPAKVEHLNSLQVFNAEQYIYSQDDDFALVRDMLRKLPEVKHGPRWA